MVMDQVAGAHSDLAVKIYGEDLHETRRIAERIEQTLRTVPGAVDVAVDQEPPLPQLQIIADRRPDRAVRAERFGCDRADRVAIGGSAISQVFVGSKSYDVTCRLNEEYRNTPEKIGSLMLTNGSGTKIPLSQVAEVRMTTGASTITREMNRRHMTVRVNLRGVDLKHVPARCEPGHRPDVKYDREEFHLKWAGQFENQHRLTRGWPLSFRWRCASCCCC